MKVRRVGPKLLLPSDGSDLKVMITLEGSIL